MKGGRSSDEWQGTHSRIAGSLAALPVGGQSQATADVYFHTDDLFSVTSLTDSAGGVIERADYGDYGERLLMDAGGALVTQVDTATNRISSRVGNPWWFTGRELDQETGLYQYRYRFMNPKIGRFVSRDPIGTWGDSSGNGAAFVIAASSPQVHADAYGLSIGTDGDQRIGPPSTIEPPYVPNLPKPRKTLSDEEWGRPGNSRGNCYRFAVCEPTAPGTPDLLPPDPNDPRKKPIPNPEHFTNPPGLDPRFISCATVMRATLRNPNVSETNKCGDCPAGTRKIGVAARPARPGRDPDFHYYREDDGVWKDKRGNTPVRKDLPDPKTQAPLDNYEFCGYLCVR